jgi:hypothetical protein
LALGKKTNHREAKSIGQAPSEGHILISAFALNKVPSGFVLAVIATSLFLAPFGQKTHLTTFSCGLLMIITQETARSLTALDAPLSIEVAVPRK